MTSVSTTTDCPQCGFDEAEHDFDCRTNEKETVCWRCGYYESWTIERGEEGNGCGWTHVVDPGFGVLYYGAARPGECSLRALHSSQELVDAEQWLRERSAKTDTKLKDAYLTRWNTETAQVELIIGEFCEHLYSAGSAAPADFEETVE